MTRPRPAKKSDPTLPTERRVLPMELHLGDRLTDEIGEYEATVRVRRVENAEVTMIRTYAAHERSA
jgi:hypothetical protein